MRAARHGEEGTPAPADTSSGPAVASPAAVDTSRSLTPVTLAVGVPVPGDVAHRWGLFRDVDGLRQVEIVPAPWGGYLVRLEVDTPTGPELRLRNLPADEFARWRDSLAAGRSVVARPLPPPPPGAVWPEVPLPPPPPETVPPRRPGPPPTLRGSWLLVLEGGVQRSLTDFADYFTTQGVVVMGVGYGAGEHILPLLLFQAGFGDLTAEFERLSGDGRSDFYAVELGTRLLAPVGGRTALRLDLCGGYYMRDMRWGGELFSGPDGLYQGAELVRSFDDWGGSVTLGLQWRIKPDAPQPHYLTVGIRYDLFGADPAVLENPETGDVLWADDHDRWLAVTFGLTVGL